MQISWNGLGCFTLTGKPIQGDVSVVTDPYENSTGLRLPRTLTAAVVVSSHNAPEANNLGAIAEEDQKPPFLVTHAGEYEVSGIFVTGILAPRSDKSEHYIYRIGLEGIQVAFLGALDRKLSDDEIAALGNIDVLILPVGGKPYMDKDLAADVVSQIEPRLVIPSHFKVQGLKQKLTDVEPFCKELSCPREDQNKLKITRSTLPADEIQVAVLSK